MRCLSAFGLSALLLAALGPDSFAAGRIQKTTPAWEQLRWGLNIEEIQELYPELEPYSSTESLSSQEPMDLFGMKLGMYKLENRSFLSLKGCRVRVELLNGLLYQLQFRCEDEPDEILRVLVQKYGFPLPADRANARWEEGRTAISLNTRSGYFALMDKRRSEKLSQAGFLHWAIGSKLPESGGSPAPAEDGAGEVPAEGDPSESAPVEQSAPEAPEAAPDPK
jgi:hypothetical protein